MTGWFNEDFTPAELRSLRAVERLPDVRPENTIDDGRYFVPTFQQVIDMAQRMSRETGRQIGLTPETKHPTCFDRTSRSLRSPLVNAIKRNGLDRPDSGIHVQSFEEADLRELDRELEVDLVRLTSPGSTARRTTTWSRATRRPTRR